VTANEGQNVPANSTRRKNTVWASKTRGGFYYYYYYYYFYYYYYYYYYYHPLAAATRGSPV